MHQLEATATSYCFEIEIEEFEAMEMRDEERWEEGEQISLFEILNAMEGVSDSDYNGHFGSFVYFTVNAEQVNDGETLRKIGDIILRYVRNEDLRL